MTVIVPRPERGYLPRIYAVPGEPFAVKFWTGVMDVGYQLSDAETLRLYSDLHDIVMARHMLMVRNGNDNACANRGQAES